MRGAAAVAGGRSQHWRQCDVPKDPFLSPSLEIVGVHHRSDAEFLEPPHASLFHEAIAEHADLPARRPLVGVPDHAEIDPTGERLVPAGQHLHHRVEQRVVVELPLGQACGARFLHELSDASRAVKRANTLDVRGRVFGKEVDDVVPHLAIDVVAVRVLQVTHRVLVIQTIDLLQQ